jgi:hypothetical protein
MNLDSDPRAWNARRASGGPHAKLSGIIDGPDMGIINSHQLSSSSKGAVPGARGLVVGLAVALVATGACKGESALFARDSGAAGATGNGGTTGDGGTGMGGTGEADAGQMDADNDASASDGAVDGARGCSGDTDCTTTQFCSARACGPRLGNLAANGDLEYGTPAGWYGIFGGGGTLLVSDTTAAGYAHAGRYSAQATLRTQLYHGPAYRLPTGPGKYTISGWAFQKDDASIGGSFQLIIICPSATQYLPPVAATLPQNVWTRFSATFDTTTVSTTPAGDCSSAGTTPGGVKLARIVVNQAANGTPVMFPDLFMDDVVVQVTDGHNLVGNSNFEGGFTDGWTAGGASVIISSTIAKTGTHSLAVTGRTTTTVGPSYAMPLGAAEYNVVFNALHTGANPHDLVLQATYTCLGGSPAVAPATTTAPSVAANVWTPIGGTIALPPPDAPVGCQLTDAAISVRQAEGGSCGGGVECPDLYVDDVSITLAQ